MCVEFFDQARRDPTHIEPRILIQLSDVRGYKLAFGSPMCRGDGAGDRRPEGPWRPRPRGRRDMPKGRGEGARVGACAAPGGGGRPALPAPFVRFLAAEVGISQFLDIGVGPSTQGAAREVVREINPTRGWSMDYDPVIVSHGQALLAVTDLSIMVHGDLRRPAELLAKPEVRAHLDFGQPWRSGCSRSCASCATATTRQERWRACAGDERPDRAGV